MDPTAFFDETLPALMKQRPADFSLNGKYLLSIRGGECWTVDLERRPPVCYRGRDTFDCLVEASREDMEALLERPERARELFYGNRMSVEGSMQMAGRIPDILSLALAPAFERGLGILFAPMSLAEFINSRWPGEPVVAHGEIGRLQELAESRQLRDVYSLLDFWKTAVRLDKNVGGALASSDLARTAYRGHGSQLSFDRAEIAIPFLKQWLSKLRNELMLPVSTFSRSIIYATPAGKGTAMHFDQNVNFVIQLRGEKEWRIAPNDNVTNPTVQYVAGGGQIAPELRSYAIGELPDEMPESSERVLLKPGSVLFVPRGYWHETYAHGESLQVNFNFDQPCWAEMVANAIYRRLVREEEWRAVAIGAGTGDPHYQQAALERLSGLLAKLPAVSGEFEAAAIIDQLTPTDAVR